MKKKAERKNIATPVFLALLAAVLAATFFINRIVLIGELVVVALGALYILLSQRSVRGKRMAYFEKMFSNLRLAKKRSLLDVPLPVTVINEKGQILWSNDKFAEYTGKAAVFGHMMDEFSKGFNARSIDKEKLYLGFEAHIEQNEFVVYGAFTRDNSENQGEQLMVLYWVDVTEFAGLKKEHSDSVPVVMMIMIDSFEELTASLSETEKASLVTKIESAFVEYAGKAEGLFLTIERGRYIYVCESRYLDEFVTGKFEILDRIREITVPSRMPVSISIGVGRDGGSFEKSNEFSKQAIDMALGRGGDQAVIKTRNNFEFYGGKSKGVEKRTKVKARIMAAALSELLDRCSNVLVMGHKYSDFDSVGACAAVARAAFVKNKKVNIIVNRDTTLAGPVIESLENAPQYEGVFVDTAQAQDLIESRTLLVVVDTHSRLYVESPDVLSCCSNIVVVDHHRKMTEFIDDAVQFYHEPFASSACEIMTEIIQYIDGNSTIIKEEAEAILAGIVLDTKNFYFKTGFRTFEAAAYLRKVGADLITLKRLFKSDHMSYIRRTELISAASFYRDNIAISIWEGERVGNAKVIMSQAADELLGIENVDASFVLYAGDSSVHISARSLGNVNVQLILEKLGGGGHLTTAGAQVDGTSEAVLAMLKSAIDEYFNDKD